MLAREATRKISLVFTQLSLLLRSENLTLKARVEQLESQLKAVSESFENARLWRENVLSGCPVLFERSGLIFTLKPFGKLKGKTDEGTEEVSEVAAAPPPLPDEDDDDEEEEEEGDLKVHMLLHGASKAFMCDLCGKTFLYNCQLKRHQKVNHDNEHGQPARRRAREHGQRRVIYRRDRTTLDVTPFGCKTCHKGFDTASALKRHELIHTGHMQYSCATCGKSFFYKATYDYHRRIHSGERPFGCGVCGKTFIIRQALKSHQLQHSGEKPHKCDQCGKDFRIYTNYLRHLRVHTGEKPYECEVCGVKFRQLGHVKFHMQVHTGERPYSCSSCGLGFSDSSKRFPNHGNLRRHLRIHTGEKPFKCETCGKSFNQADTLRGHQRIHSGERPFSCETCGKGFIQKSALKMHQKTSHWEDNHLVCVACGSKLACVDSLRKHVQTHAVVPCDCAICGQRLGSVAELRSHQQLHTVTRPHSCSRLIFPESTIVTMSLNSSLLD
uniref:C2H2-type domain-containing protein n=1 Tax=Salarias fasciatus TaxID=181472 RepID=A0A672HWQ5_SALFA